MVLQLARSSASSSDHDLSYRPTPHISYSYTPFYLIFEKPLTISLKTFCGYGQLLSLPTTIVHPTKLVAMGPFSAVADIIELTGTLIYLTVSLKHKEIVAISRAYGRTLGWIITTFFRETATEYQRISEVVLQGTDEDALRFRGSVTSECNMTAVAVSIYTLIRSIYIQTVYRAPLSPKLRSRRSPCQA